MNVKLIAAIITTLTCGSLLTGWILLGDADDALIERAFQKRQIGEALRLIDQSSSWSKPEKLLLKLRAARLARQANEIETCLSDLSQFKSTLVDFDTELTLLRAEQGDTTPLLVAFGTPKFAPRKDEAYEALCRGYLRIMRFDMLTATIEEWEAEIPNSPGPSNFRAIKALYNRDYKTATQHATRSLQKQSNYPPALLTLAEAAQKSGDKATAVQNYRVYLDLMPRQSTPQLGLAQSLIGLNEHQEATKELKAIVDTWPRQSIAVEARILLAKLSLEMGNFESTIEYLDDVIASWPMDQTTNYLLAQAHQQLGNEQDSEKFYARSQTASEQVQDIFAEMKQAHDQPENESLRADLGHRLLHYHSRSLGIEFLNAALAINPRNPSAHEDLAYYYSSISNHRLEKFHRAFCKPNETIQSQGL